MEIVGYIKKIDSRIDVSSNVVQVVTIQVYGDITNLHALMKRPVKIKFEQIENLKGGTQ